jgi:hypothetical protein
MDDNRRRNEDAKAYMVTDSGRDSVLITTRPSYAELG